MLFLLSRTLTRTISFLFFTITKSKKFTIHILALLFLPGTAVHELAHAITAGILGVPVGKIEFVPVVEGDKVKLGSVQVGKTDFFRRFLIGSAPFFIGTTIILSILYFTAQNKLFDNYLMTIIIGYIVFEIGNTMFSSRKDMEGALELFITILIITVIFYFLGVRLPAVNPEVFFDQPLIINIFQYGCLFLLVPIVLDMLLIGLLKVIQR